VLVLVGAVVVAVIILVSGVQQASTPAAPSVGYVPVNVAASQHDVAPPPPDPWQQQQEIEQLQRQQPH
jgi:hypothetical protein